MSVSAQILWADDEIELLRAHILFLESRGYGVTTVSNGTDAVDAVVRSDRFDVVLLDEQMPGIGGLDTLAAIKQARPELPVVMVTKSEEEQLMEEALGGQISDYLTKPVNPSQILLTIKRLLERQSLRHARVSQDYLQRFRAIAASLSDSPDHHGWVCLYRELVQYDLGLDGDEGARQILGDQYREANRAFGRHVASAYPDWLTASHSDRRPVLSHEVIRTWVLPALSEKKPVVFFVIDCLRYDQWLEFERLLAPAYTIEKSFYYSILPTATPFARNAIFSGLLPRDIARRYPHLWQAEDDDETSQNRHEDEFLQLLLKRLGCREVRTRYRKLIGNTDGRAFTRDIKSCLQWDLSAVVVNFVDILAHSRADSQVIRELAPDERAYRALTRTWFEHSWLYQALQTLATLDCTVVVTTDHGAIRSLHGTKVRGHRDTSTALRFKFGNALTADRRHAIVIRDPAAFGLPASRRVNSYLVATEDFYFVYPTNYHYYLNLYRDTMQHGGASMEEMILPVITLRPRRP